MTVWNDPQFTQRLAHANWMANVAVQIHHNERATGDPAREWMGSWARRWFVRDNTRVLVLGCGEGWLERSIAHWPFIESIHAVDFAAEAVERARAAAPPKITYGVVDLNRDELPPKSYDIVVAHAVLHHVANLEHAYAQIERTLRDDGTLILNEYVGPNRFQYSDRVLGFMNELLQCLPPELRRGAVDPVIYEERRRPTVEEMIATDPTEAVRAEELIAFTENTFEVIDRRNIGGTILQHLLYDLAQNFRFDVPHERAMVELLCTIEAMLVDAKAIPCDFVLMAARKKGAPRIARYRGLVERSEDAKSIDPDPLKLAGGGQAILPVPDRRDRLSSTHLRMLRIALASTQPRRANLFVESPLRGTLERFRARNHDPYAWIQSRAPHAHPAIQALIRTAATLAPLA
ncbi:MAG TPA: methyltransferase domain-containing protein [Thermoanaerobaculia bacterium]|nr:methyltransferase domain-containing protein [Thermoanaerobaculia bacterium]